MVANWALKRAFKFVLKKALGPIIKGDVDLDQLDVNVSSGTAELRDLLLNTDHLNQNLLATTNLRITAGCIGRATAEVPLTSLHSSPCAFQLDDVILHARVVSPQDAATEASQRSGAVDNGTVAGVENVAVPGAAGVGLGGGSSRAGPGGWWGDEGAAQDDNFAGSSIAEGIRLITGSLESLLHRLSLRANNISVHILFPALPSSHTTAAATRGYFQQQVGGAEFRNELRNGAPLDVGCAEGEEQHPSSTQEGGAGPSVLLTLRSFEFDSRDRVRAEEGSGSRAASLLLDHHCCFEGLLMQLLEPTTAAAAAQEQPALRSKQQPDRPAADAVLHDASAPAQRQTGVGGSCMPLLCNNEGDGCCGEVVLKLSSSDGLAKGKLEVAASLEPLQLHVYAAQLPLLQWIAATCATQQPWKQNVQPQTATPAANESSEGVCSGTGSQQLEPATVTAVQQLLRGLLLPDMQSFLSDALAWGAPSVTAPLLRGDWENEPGADAGAAIGRQVALSGAEGMIGGVESCTWGGASSLAERPDECALWQSVYLSNPVLEVTSRVTVGELTTVLWYLPESSQSAACCAMGPKSRCAVEASNVALTLQMSSQGMRMELQMQRLEAAEYLPWQGDDMHDRGPAPTSSSSTALQQFAQLPEQLPPLPASYAPRPTPTFSGLVALDPALGSPGAGTMYQSAQQSMFSSTLSQLSLLTSSRIQGSVPVLDNNADEQGGYMQVCPVVAVCASRSGAALAFVVDVPTAAAASAAATAVGGQAVNMQCNLGPTSAWVTQGLLHRVHEVAAVVASKLQQDVSEATVEAEYHDTGHERSRPDSREQHIAVAEVISCIMQELNGKAALQAVPAATAVPAISRQPLHTEAEEQQQLRFCLHAPQVCLAVATPELLQAATDTARSDNTPPTTLPLFYALDVLQEQGSSLPGARQPEAMLTVSSPADASLSSSMLMGPLGAGAEQPGWQVQVALGAASMYACAALNSRDGSGLQVHRLLSLQPPIHQNTEIWSPLRRVAAHVDVQLRPGLASEASELESAWAYAQQQSGKMMANIDASGIHCEPVLDRVTLQHRAVAGSPLLTQVELADAAFYLCPGDLPAMWATADRYLNLTDKRRQALQAFAAALASAAVNAQGEGERWAEGMAHDGRQSGQHGEPAVQRGNSSAQDAAAVAGPGSATGLQAEQGALMVTGRVSVICNGDHWQQEPTAAAADGGQDGHQVSVCIGDLNLLSISAAGGVAEASVLSVQCREVAITEHNMPQPSPACASSTSNRSNIGANAAFSSMSPPGGSGRGDYRHSARQSRAMTDDSDSTQRVVLCLPMRPPVEVSHDGEPMLEVLQVTRPLAPSSEVRQEVAHAASHGPHASSAVAHESQVDQPGQQCALSESLCSVHLRGCQVAMQQQDAPPTWVGPLAAPMQGPVGPQLADEFPVVTTDTTLHFEDSVVILNGHKADAVALIGAVWCHLATPTRPGGAPPAGPPAQGSATHAVSLQCMALFARATPPPAGQWSHQDEQLQAAGAKLPEASWGSRGGAGGWQHVVRSDGLTECPCVCVEQAISRKLLGRCGFLCALEEEEVNLRFTTTAAFDDKDDEPQQLVEVRNHRLCSRLDCATLTALLLVAAELPKPVQPSTNAPRLPQQGMTDHESTLQSPCACVLTELCPAPVTWPATSSHSPQTDYPVANTGQSGKLSTIMDHGLHTHDGNMPLDGLQLPLQLRNRPISPAQSWADAEGAYSSAGSSTGMLSCDTWEGATSWGAAPGILVNTGSLAAESLSSTPGAAPATSLDTAAAWHTAGSLCASGNEHVAGERYNTVPCTADYSHPRCTAMLQTQHGDQGFRDELRGGPTRPRGTADTCQSPPSCMQGLLQQLQEDAFRASAMSDMQPPATTASPVQQGAGLGGRWFAPGSPSGTPTGLQTACWPVQPTEATVLGGHTYPQLYDPGQETPTPAVIEDFVDGRDTPAVPSHGQSGVWHATSALCRDGGRRPGGEDVWADRDGWEAASDEEDGRWYHVTSEQGDELGEAGNMHSATAFAAEGAAVPLSIQEDYIPVPAVAAVGAPVGAAGAATLCSQCAVGPLGPWFPRPLFRLVVQDVCLHVELRSSGTAQGQLGTPGSVSRGGVAEPQCPMASELLEVQIDRLCVQVDSFDSEELYAHRIAVAIHFLEVRDWGPQQGPRGVSIAAPQGLAPLHHCRRLLGMHSSNRINPSNNCSMVHIVVEAVRPSVAGRKRALEAPARSARTAGATGQATACYVGHTTAAGIAGQTSPLGVCQQSGLAEQPGPPGPNRQVSQGGGLEAASVGSPLPLQAAESVEYRMSVACVPLKVELDQGALLLLRALSQLDLDSDPVLVEGPVLGVPAVRHDEAVVSHGSQVFFQRCEFADVHVVLDYTPRHFDLTALRQGDLAELVNLIPLGGVDLRLAGAVFWGVQSPAALASNLLTHWLDDISSTQAHKFLQGIAPIRSLLRIGGAALQLLSVPVEQFFTCNTNVAGAATALGLLADRRTDVRGGVQGPLAPGPQPGANGLGPSVSWKLQRAVLRFLRVIAMEALGLGATVAAGAQYLFKQSGATASRTAGAR